MNKLTTFFQTIFKSSTNPAYYNDVLRAPKSFSWKYFLAFNLLAALVTGITLLIPVALVDLVANLSRAVTIFPSDLVVTGDSQGLSINQELPYSVALPREWDEDQTSDGEMTNLVTFTSDDAIEGIEDVKAADALFVLTSSTMYISGDDQEVRVYPMPEFDEPFTLDRAMVESYMNQVVNHPLIKYKLYIPLLLLISLVVIYPLMLLVRGITLVIYASIVWVITSLFLKTKGLTWSQVFQISMHSITPVVIIAYLLGILSLFFFQGLPYFLVYLIWTLVVISQLGVARTMKTTASVGRQPVVASKPRTRRLTATKVKSKRSKKA